MFFKPIASFACSSFFYNCLHAGTYLACSLHQQCLPQQSCDGFCKAALPPGPSLASSRHDLKLNLEAHLSLLHYTRTFRTSQASCTKQGHASSSKESLTQLVTHHWGKTAVSIPQTETSQKYKAIDVSVDPSIVSGKLLTSQSHKYPEIVYHSVMEFLTI